MPLVGRDAEREGLSEILRGALAHRGGIAYINGEAGIGKTRLVQEFKHEAKNSGVQVLEGRCFEEPPTPVYGPWYNLFSRSSGLGHAEIPRSFSQSGPVSVMDRFTGVRAFFECLNQRGPLLLIFEDLHWADYSDELGDSPSIRLLQELVRSFDPLPFSIFITYRSESIRQGHPLMSLLVDKIDFKRMIEPQRLDVASLRELISTLYALPAADVERLAAYLRELTSGVPYDVEQVLSTLVTRGVLHRSEERWSLSGLDNTVVPLLSQQHVAARFAHLDGAAKNSVVTAAVIGQEIPWLLWKLATKADADTLHSALAQATERNLLRRTTDGAEFAHALTRKTIYNDIPPGRLLEEHRQVAEALKEWQSPEPSAIAEHFARANDRRAVDWLIVAGENAQRVYAGKKAAEYFQRALDLMDGSDPDKQAWLLVRQAILYRYTDPQRGVVLLDRAHRLAVDAGDQPLEAFVHFCRGLLLCINYDLSTGLAVMAVGVAHLQTLNPETLRRIRLLEDAIGIPVGTGRGTLAFWLAIAGRYVEAEEMSQAVIEVPGVAKEGLSGLADAHTALLRVYASRGEFTKARENYNLACDKYSTARTFRSLSWVTIDYLEMMALTFFPEDIRDRASSATAAQDAFSRSGTELASLPPRWSYLPLMFVDEPWIPVEQLIDNTPAAFVIAYRSFAARVIGPMAREQGRPEIAWAIIKEHLPAEIRTPEGSVNYRTALVLQRLAIELALDKGDFSLAQQWLEAHDRWIEWSGTVVGQSEQHLLWARYHLAQRENDKAIEHANSARAAAENPRQPLALIAVYCMLDTLNHTESFLNDALILAESCAARYERALILLTMAELRLTVGQYEEVNGLLGEVRVICEELGARRVLRRQEDLVHRLNETHSRRREYPNGLTPAEVEILRLLAEGITDSEIASRRKRKVSTIRTQLTTIYGKIREDLPDEKRGSRGMAAKWFAVNRHRFS